MHEVMTIMEPMMGKLELLQKDIDSVKKDQSDLRQGTSGADQAGKKPREAASGAEVNALVATQKPADVAERSTLPIGVTHKIYALELEEDLVSELGDSRFLANKLTWDRLMQDYPVDPEVQRRLVGLAFEGAAKRIYETITAVNLSARAEEL